jgi:tetratricopeptide (TPR) repeat protein
LILSATCIPGGDVAAKTAAEIFEKVSAGVVIVQVYNEKGKNIGLGSGVVLPNGDVATNYHVIENAIRIKVYQGGKDYQAVLRYSDRDRDVCSLSVPGMKTVSVVEGGTKTLKVGSRVYAIGNPEGLELTLSEGIISSLRPVEGGQYLQITTPISPGSSGGGLFDEEGRLVGLTTFYLAEGQQLNFAVPVEWIDELPRRHKKDVETAETYVEWLDKWRALETKKDFAGLINHAMKRTKAFPGDANAWDALGLAYEKSGEFEKAIETYEHALRIDPEFVEAWTNIGNAYDKSGQPAKAIEAYQHALRIDPEHASAWYNLGSVYSEAGDFAKEIEADRQALRIDPEFAEAWNNLGVDYAHLGVDYHQSDQFAKAIEAHRQAVRINPEYLEAWSNLCMDYTLSGQSGKAVGACQQALRINPEFASAWYFLCIVYTKTGQRGQATEAYRRLKTLDSAMAGQFMNKFVLP